MVRAQPATDSFEQLIKVEPQELNLAAAALAFAQDVYPDLDRAAYLERLDGMARQAGEGLSPRARPVEVLGRLNAYLFQEQGFSGNRDSYADPRNSYLNEVMDRRLGIPITLSMLYLELAWRLGLRCEGVGFPGHFLIKCTVSGGQAVLDPFNEGASLGEEDLMRMAAHSMGPERAARDRLRDLIVAADRRAILGRMLRNLKFIHLSQGENDDALRVVNRMLSLDPSSSADLLDRARLYDEMGAMRAALADYRAVVEMVGNAADLAEIHTRVQALQGQVRRLN